MREREGNRQPTLIVAFRIECLCTPFHCMLGYAGWRGGLKRIGNSHGIMSCSIGGRVNFFEKPIRHS